MRTSLWIFNIPFLASVQCEKGSMHFPLNRYSPCKESPPSFLWPNANSICGHKLIKQINTTHLLVAILIRFWHWYINTFLGWPWPPLSCADRIAGNIVGGTSKKLVNQPRHYQIFTIGSKIKGSSSFLC